MSRTHSYSKEDVASALKTASFWFDQSTRGKSHKVEITFVVGRPDCGVRQAMVPILVFLIVSLESHIAGCGGVYL